MSCFDVVYHQSPHHPGYLAYQRSVPNSPIKKRCRLDPDLHHQAGVSSPVDGLYYDRVLSFPGTDDPLKPDHPLQSSAAAKSGLSGHSTCSSSFPSALTSPSTSSTTSPPATSSSSTSSSSCAASSTSLFASSVVVALKCELMTSSSASNDDDEAQQPVMTQPIGGNGVLLTYFSEDIDTNIDNHFHRALQLAQQHGGAHRSTGRRFNAASASSAIADSKSQGSSCCRQESSPHSQRSFPASFWNTVSCSSSNSSNSTACPSSSSSSSSSYHPSNGSWSSLMVSPKADTLAAAFTVSPNPSDPYHLNTHFASAASPPCAFGPLHQDPWNPYAFCPPPPAPSQPGYRRYRHSIHEFSFSSDSPCSLGAAAGSHFGSGMRYKSLLNGSVPAGRDDPKSHAAAAAAAAAAATDVWRSRCYGCADVASSHIAAGFTLSGGIEVTQTNLPDASGKDVYWF